MKMKSLVILKMINIYFVMCKVEIQNKLYKNIQVHPSIDIIGECSTDIATKLFSLDHDIKVIFHKSSYEKLRLLKTLFTKFTITLSDKIHNAKARENLIIMSNNLSYLKDTFSTPKAHLYSHYLVLTQMPVKELMNFAVSLRKQKYVYVAFLIMNSERRMMGICQEKTGCRNCDNTDVLSPSGMSYKDVLFDLKISELTPFRKILCPVFPCELKFIRVDYGASKEELYDINKNGKSISADSYGGCVLNAFAKFYNVTITREEYLGNYTWHNAIEILNNGKVDMVFGPTLPPYKLVADLDKVVPYTFEEFVFIDAMPKIRPPIYVLITSLGIEIGICCGLVALLYFIYVISITNLYKKNMINEKLYCLHLIAISLNQVVHLPKKMGLRLVIIMWLIYTFFMNNVYTSNFTSSMIKIEPPNKLQTFQELQFSKRKLGGPDVAKEWLFNTDDPIMMNLYERYEVIHPDNTSHALYNLGMVVAQTDYLIAKTKMTKFYALKEKIVSYPLFYYIPKGHPFAPHIAKFMEKIRESNMPLTNCLVEARKFVIKEFNAITMIHLQIIFKFLTLSLLISMMIFLMEFLM